MNGTVAQYIAYIDADSMQVYKAVSLTVKEAKDATPSWQVIDHGKGTPYKHSTKSQHTALRHGDKIINYYGFAKICSWLLLTSDVGDRIHQLHTWTLWTIEQQKYIQHLQTIQIHKEPNRRQINNDAVLSQKYFTPTTQLND